jgi:hypothetical protein
MKKSRYQLFILDEGEDGKITAKFLGGCKSPAQATVMFNNAYAEKKLTKPKQVLLVPSANIFGCKPVQSFQLEAMVEGMPDAEANNETNAAGSGQSQA